MNWVWFHRFGSPPYFYSVAGRIVPWLAWPATLLIIAGLYGGLVLAPPDYQQSDAARIMYVHVPAAYVGLMAYVVMALAAAIGLVWRLKVSHAVAAGCAPIGASFTAVCLVTGMLWGQPMWGTWWAWDPRLVSMLVLLFFYLGYLGLRGAIDDTARADRASAVLAVSVWSMCPSCITQWCGGTRCIKGPACCVRAALPCRPRCGCRWC